ncbi:MAG: amidohydrolase family protein [Bacteroidota bacterium]|nr:amidohydrolase family protein [Bacteroidota bacterium]MDP3146285.1 amidohydrolase family protein [Bacteroidota bacterium]MDP3556391.1 amidohydrolase family protein [Bacteroidota bacterium]
MRFLAANRIFDGKQYLPEGSVLLLDSQNRLKEVVLESAIEKKEIEFFDGIITPGFVNTHCHLELSHLKNKIQKHTGIPEFGKQIITQRMSGFTKEEIFENANAADKEMWDNGIVAVGDISNNDDSFKTKQNSKLFYHTFVEVLGLNPINQLMMLDFGLTILKQLQQNNLTGSMAAHAPYSTSLELIESIANYDKENNLPFSIHNQETEEETKFFLGQENDFKKLYDFLKLDISWFKAPGCSSLKSFIDVVKNQRAILVHNTFSSCEDVALASEKNCFFCFCPNANLYIENKLPDFNLFKNFTNSICIGTDSLASNDALNLVEEVNLLLNNTAIFTLENCLQMITFNGAKALNITNEFGQLLVGKNAGLNLIDFKNNQLKFIKKLT